MDTNEIKDPVLTCLIVEDDPRVAQLLSDLVQEHQFRATIAPDVTRALNFLSEKQPDLLLLDHGLPDGYGSTVFDHAINLYPSVRALMLTAFPSVQEAVRLTQRGLFKYLPKPFDLVELETILKDVSASLQQERAWEGSIPMLGHSPQIRRIIESLRMAAPHWRASVLFTGETGTGKEMAALTLHHLTWGHQKQPAPFIPINCAGIPMELLESELFGAAQGSYTGANRNRKGLVAEAESGTLFLDEIGEIPLALQSKLLRFLESREYRQLGSTAFKHFTGRIVLATNRDLLKEVHCGRFREDLYHRLNVLNIHLPPLRDRREDIQPLALHFLNSICHQIGRSPLTIRPDDLNQLRNLSFPGNVRELRNLIEKSVIQTPLQAKVLHLTFDCIPTEHQVGLSQPIITPAQTDSNTALISVIEFEANRRQISKIDAAEALLVSEAVQRHPHNLAQAARWLGISRQALYRKLHRHRISGPS